jgi:predicted DNA-binding transcriptional regulator AlpA
MPRKLQSLPSRRALSAEDIERDFGVEKIYLRVAQGRFPPPIWLGPGEHVWISSEIDAWNETRIAALEARIATRKSGKVVSLRKRKPPQRVAADLTGDGGDDTPKAA